MARTRRKIVGRADSGGFFALPNAVLESPNYRMLSAHAVKLLCDLGAQYRGANNGDLSATWSIMHARGWRSRDTLGRAMAELLHFGLIERTRQGGMHQCSLFALTWQAIDDCKGKLDCAPSRVASGKWRQPQAAMPKPERKKSAPSTTGVSIRHGPRVNSPRIVELSTRQACQS
ncbi:MAG: hypothetical protein ACYCUI_15195 [Vulcanimicrobiaceae bacterium]